MTPLARRDSPDGTRDRIAALSRSDKWFLGGLDGIVWAPPFPSWLHKPGFWDPAHIFQHEMGPCFSVALLDERGEEIPLSLSEEGAGRAGGSDRSGIRWQPGSMTVWWDPGSVAVRTEEPRKEPRKEPSVLVREARSIRGGVLESAWQLPVEVGGRWLVAFTALPRGGGSQLRGGRHGLSWSGTATDTRGRTLAVDVEMTGAHPPDWTASATSEGGAAPVWQLSPFPERLAARLSAGSLEERGKGANQGAAGRNSGAADEASGPTGTAGEPTGAGRQLEQPGDGGSWTWVAAAFPVSEGEAVVRLRLAPRLPSQESNEDWRRRRIPAWESFFRGFPAFRCGDPFMDRYFDYRIYGLGLNRTGGGWGNIRHPAICEGPEYFHVPIAYSAPCHMMEMRWHARGREAWGSLMNFLEHQKKDGSFHGRIYPGDLRGTHFYHANWGDALLAVHRMHPNRVALRRCYDGLARYADWLRTARDPEDSGMFTVENHYETGQEYMSRYMAVSPDADAQDWEPRLRLKGIDVTVYGYLLFRALAAVARELNRPADAEEWRRLEDRSGAAITDRMWSPEAGLFTDVDARTLERTGVKAAVGFYPMLAGLADDERLDAMMDHLENPATFGTFFPVPSSSVDDPRFSAEGVWKGTRRNCPWNGRVWPMTTSHVIEGLLRMWRRGNRRAGELAARMIPRFLEMMFDGGDPDRPNCYEHYNPRTGRACYFRGIDDYQHSWVLDLLARGVAGLEVDEEGLAVHPLPHGLRDVSLGPVRARGLALSVRLSEKVARLEVARLDLGKEPDMAWHYECPRGEPLRVAWEDLR